MSGNKCIGIILIEKEVNKVAPLDNSLVVIRLAICLLVCPLGTILASIAIPLE